MICLLPKYIGAFALFVFVLFACAPNVLINTASNQPARVACAPRPTRTPNLVSTETRDPHPKSPTAAPTRTPGPPVLNTNVPLPTLTQSLDTVEHALQYVLDYEIRANVQWENPWCLETFKTEPERIQVRWYPWRGYNGEGYGYSVPNGPTVVVSIKGKVRYPFICGLCSPPKNPEAYNANGITYEFSRDTGMLWGVGGGARDLPAVVTIVPTFAPRTRKPRTPRAVSETPTATPTLRMTSGTTTPTIDMAGLPPLPPPPTGPSPARLPTFDIRRLTTPDPNALPFGTEEPTEEPGAVPTLGHIELITPDSMWTTYTHPELGFSFQYPSNWDIEVSEDPPPNVSTEIIIQSYLVKGMPKGDKTPFDQLIKIEISADPEFEQYGDIDAWFEHYKTTQKGATDPESHPVYPNFEHTTVAGVPAVRWFVPGPDGYTSVTFGKGKWLYQISALPGNSRYNKLFERILASFQIP